MKKGWRFLVYAESFSREKISNKSILVGAIINSTSFLEEFRAKLITLYGLDSTQKALEIYNELGREDINFIIFSGVVIALYNIINLTEFYEKTKKPVLAISYRESQGLEDILKQLPMPEERLKIYQKNGERIKIKLNNGFSIYIRTLGLSVREAKNILNKITMHGKIPEPVKVAKAIAKSLLFSINQFC